MEERPITIIARRDPENPAALHWGIILQEEEETVFFAW
jgi:hypothetical protein